MKLQRSLCVASVLVLFFCISQAHAISQEEREEFADEENMAQAMDGRENMLIAEEAQENSYDVPQSDDMMKIKEEDREGEIQGERSEGWGGWR